MAKQVVGSWSDWSGKLKDLLRQIDDGSINLLEMQAFLEHRNPFDPGFSDINWQEVYDFLGMATEYAEFIKTHSVVEKPNLWTMPVVKGITCNKVVAAIRKLGVSVYLYTEDLDKSVPTNDRDPNSNSYVVSFKRSIEADEENKNLSANDLAKRGHKGITLLERLLLELGYFLATGKHLDEKNWTLCTGSRFSGGYVPGVSWSPDFRRVYVYWYYSDGRNDDLRSRSVVSF